MNKKNFKIILVFLPLVFLILVIFLFLTVILIYRVNSDYGFILSQKIKSHAYFLQEEQYNEKYSLNKNFGEFCYRFYGDELNTKKIHLSLDEQMIRGSVYARANLYGGKVDPKTLNLEIDNQPATWHWKWYNWFGIGLDKVYQQTLEEMVNSPLPVLQSNEIKSNFQYDEVVKEKIGVNGGILQNADKSVVVTIPPLQEETEFTLSFKKSDFEVKSGVGSPITINISPDINLTDSVTPIKIKIKYDAKYNLPVGYLVDKNNKLQSVDIGELDKEKHYFALYTLHGGDYSWIYAN